MANTTQCVLREVAQGDHQYVPVADVISRMGSLIPGEVVYIGGFSEQKERLGPYGSDERTICLPTTGLSKIRAGSDGQVTVH